MCLYLHIYRKDAYHSAFQRLSRAVGQQNYNIVLSNAFGMLKEVTGKCIRMTTYSDDAILGDNLES